jgi:EmrB/QacA subfamily drug resistance transporter
MVAVGTSVLLATIDGSIVNVALPTMRADFGTTFNVIQWVALSYLLTLATLTLGVGRLGDVLGKKRIFILGFAVFTVASVLCGLAPNIELLIVFRVVQAVGGTMMLALGASILIEAFPPQERGKALGWIGTAVSVGIITGPVAGGLLISAFDWQAIFFVNVPVGVVGLWLAARAIPDLAPIPGQRMDYLGAGVLSVTLLALSLALTLGQGRGFDSLEILALFALALVGMFAFVILELRLTSPMIDLRTFREPLLSVSVVTGLVTFVAVSAVFFLLPFYLEGVLDFAVREVGLLLSVTPLFLGVTSPLSGSLSDRIGVRRLTLAGLAVLTLAFAALRTIDVDTSVPAFLALLIPIGIGMGLFQSPNNSAIMSSVPREYSGVASGILTQTRLLGQIAGIAVLGSVWAARVAAQVGGLEGGDAVTAPDQVQVAALHDTFAIATLLLAGATVLGFWGLREESRRAREAPGTAGTQARVE